MPHEDEPRYIEGNITVSATTGTVTSETSEIGEIAEGMFLVSVDVHRNAGTPPVLVRVDVLQRSRTYTALAEWSRGVATNAAHGAKWWTGSIPILRDALLRVAVVNNTGSTQSIGVDFILSDLPLDGGVIAGRNRAWPDGATFVFQGTVVNNGAISDVSAIFTPGAGNEMDLHWASISHNDATASAISVLIRDDGPNTLIALANQAAVTQNSVIQVPPVGTVTATTGNFPQFTRPIMISGTMDLILTAEDIDDTEGITVALVARIVGGVPTLTTVGGGAETVTTNTSRVF